MIFTGKNHITLPWAVICQCSADGVPAVLAGEIRHFPLNEDAADDDDYFYENGGGYELVAAMLGALGWSLNGSDVADANDDPGVSHIVEHWAEAFPDSYFVIWSDDEGDTWNIKSEADMVKEALVVC